MRTPEHQNPSAVSWSDIRDLTPMLFLHDEHGQPPQVARRLWAAISGAGLNRYETDIERSDVMSLLLTKTLIFQEFQTKLRRHQTMLCPQSIAQYLKLQPSHIAVILDNNKIGPTTGEGLDDVLTLDLVNRDCVAEAILDHFGGRDEVFRILAFPRGLSAEQRQMPLDELVVEFDLQWFSDGQFLEVSVAPDWEAGFAFIDSGFERTHLYTEIKQS